MPSVDLPEEPAGGHLGGTLDALEVAMKVLIVFAHPEPRSLNGALKDVAVQELEAQGHEVRITDLYAEGWKSQVDRADFPTWPADEPLAVGAASKADFATGTLTPDVAAEIDKLLWADALILQFPLWWYAMPAILKGWVDRVYAYGFAYGVGEHSDRRWGDRFGEGVLAGKRAMLSVTIGGWAEHYAPRGVNGPIDDLLFPINHGILYYPGYDVLPPFVTYRVDRFGPDDFARVADQLRERMRTLFEIAPIAYRRQNGGDYVIPAMQLKPGLETPGATGFALHVAGSQSTFNPETPLIPAKAGTQADFQRVAPLETRPQIRLGSPLSRE
ncbi:NAD(P)H-dependent oxidoreductase [Caulobacter sp. 1776]|uniref:NAD(P)H-dependent oxidoreductase n=1 Tax=Caulobacter sp. 1776 TaxID=3156420 RepID=UPI003390F4DC